MLSGPGDVQIPMRLGGRRRGRDGAAGGRRGGVTTVGEGSMGEDEGEKGEFIGRCRLLLERCGVRLCSASASDALHPSRGDFRRATVICRAGSAG